MATITQPSREVILAERLDNFLRTIVSAIGRSTNNPQIVHHPNEALFTLAVDQKDQGRFVGKHGATIWSIQTLFWFAGLTQFGYSYSVRLLGPEKPPKRVITVPLKFTPNWPRKVINNLVTEILGACLPDHADYRIREADDINAIIELRLPKYLQMQLDDPSFTEAFATVLRIAGVSNGVSIKTETTFN